MSRELNIRKQSNTDLLNALNNSKRTKEGLRYSKKRDSIVNAKKFKKGLKKVESADGLLMRNKQKESTATGYYGQLYSEIKHLPIMKGVSRTAFEKDTKLQDSIMNMRMRGSYKDNKGTKITGHYKDSKDLKKEFPNTNLRNDELMAVSHYRGRGGARKYLKSIRDNTSYKVEKGNKTVEDYLKVYNEGYKTEVKEEVQPVDLDPVWIEHMKQKSKETPKYAKGGTLGCGGKGEPPCPDKYVKSKDDPRYLAYKDSLNIYNSNQRLVSNLKKEGYSARPINSMYDDDKINRDMKKYASQAEGTYKYNTPSNIVVKANPQKKGRLYEVDDLVPHIIDERLGKQLFSDKIMPLGKRSWSEDILGIPGLGDKRVTFDYSNVKPKQKVIYQDESYFDFLKPVVEKTKEKKVSNKSINKKNTITKETPITKKISTKKYRGKYGHYDKYGEFKIYDVTEDWNSQQQYEKAKSKQGFRKLEIGGLINTQDMKTKRELKKVYKKAKGGIVNPPQEKTDWEKKKELLLASSPDLSKRQLELLKHNFDILRNGTRNRVGTMSMKNLSNLEQKKLGTDFLILRENSKQNEAQIIGDKQYKKAKGGYVPKAMMGSLLSTGMQIAGSALQADADAKYQKEQEKESINLMLKQKGVMDNNVLDNFETQGTYINSPYLEEGGKLNSTLYSAEGGDLKPISSDGVVVDGPTHDNGGVTLYKGDTPVAEVEKDEVIIGNKAYSKKLKNSKGISYADAVEKVGKQKGKLENRLKEGVNKIGKQTVERQISSLEAEEKRIFEEQEQYKINNNIEQEYVKKYGSGGEFAKLLLGVQEDPENFDAGKAGFSSMFKSLVTAGGGASGPTGKIPVGRGENFGKMGQDGAPASKASDMFIPRNVEENTNYSNTNSANIPYINNTNVPHVNNNYPPIPRTTEGQAIYKQSKGGKIPKAITGAVLEKEPLIDEEKLLKEQEQAKKEAKRKERKSNFNRNTVPFLDNATNLISTLTKAQVPKPTMTLMPSINTKHNAAGQLAEVKNTTERLVKTGMENSSSGTTAREFALRARMGGTEKVNKILENKENIESKKENDASLLGLQVQNINADKLDTYKTELVKRSNAISNELSYNSSEAFKNIQDKQAVEDKNAFIEKMVKLEAEAGDRGGSSGRVDIKLKDGSTIYDSASAEEWWKKSRQYATETEKANVLKNYPHLRNLN